MALTKQGVRRERRMLTEVIKAEAVRSLTERRATGESASQVGWELNVRPDPLRTCARLQHEAAGGGEPVAGETLEQKNRRLRRVGLVVCSKPC